MLQVCLNGPRGRAECPTLPITPEQLAAAARAAVAAGAENIHLHARDSEGRDTLEAAAVAAAVSAVRAAVPDIPVGVTTGAWASPDPQDRVARIAAWTVLPDHASVNWHEEGACEVAAVLLERGVGIEAGIFSGTPAARQFLDWPQAHRVLRVLAEVTETTPRKALDAADRLLGELEAAAAPLLLHGQDEAAWSVLRLAATRGLDTRIGFEDVLHLPDGTPARDNAALVREARAALQHPDPGPAHETAVS
ncbi:3-keto-5-aminohexanoate cleavage protein [Streptomyces sp. NBC_00199]|uniref:3-keto-5-aminohexanoate cleavage protein n=1 Tax=Streptomyces sp. NBC_00199 TaxID=2975678 RepID=UPI002250790F|nr:3-keto-5-aminohexanoate cleavage protein [Streptomyces sp. NBC_00199]MCX5265959.1 3-keto-5-aminohexanoate cleavage protein [Streptomyces sp. NBC_00199]